MMNQGDSMKVKDAITHRFREICEERSIHFNELATLSGVTPSTVYSMMDPRRRDLSVITVKKLCDGLQISLKEFFSGEVFDKLEQEMY